MTRKKKPDYDSFLKEYNSTTPFLQDPAFLRKHFKNHYNSLPEAGEKNELPSKTIPDQSLSIPELISRYARGLSLQGVRQPEYTGDDDPLNGLDWKTLDLSEKDEFIRNSNDELESLTSKIKKDAAKKSQPAPQPTPPPPPTTLPGEIPSGTK